LCEKSLAQNILFVQNWFTTLGTAKGNAETREAILDATDRLLVTHGFRRVTIDEIAVEAGVSRRTVYMYFPSKEEVGLSSIDRVVETTHRHLVKLAAGGGDPAETLHKILVGRVLSRVDSVRPYRTSLDELFEAVRPAYMARRAVHLAREAAVVAGVLEAGRAAGRFDVDDAGATASTLIKATNAFLPYSLSVDELGERDRIAAEVRRMAGLLLQGLLVRAPEAAEAPAKQATRPRGPRPAR
jgi:AcrR family transcriptional regulator